MSLVPVYGKASQAIVTTGRAKSKLTNVRAYCSACVDPISIIFLDMSWISYSFEEYTKLNLKWVHFFRMNVHFRIFLVFGWYLSHFRILHYVWPLVIRDPWKNGVANVSDSRDTKHNVLKWTANRKMNDVRQSAYEHFCCMKISAMHSEIKNETILKISSLWLIPEPSNANEIRPVTPLSECVLAC